MKRFRFRLQRLANLKDQIRDEARQELGRRNAELAHEESVLRELRDELLRLQLGDGGTLTASEIMLMGAYAARVRGQIEDQTARVQAAQIAVVEARERFLAAEREAKALSMLKDKKREEHNAEALRDEVSHLDEVAIQRVGRREQV